MPGVGVRRTRKADPTGDSELSLGECALIFGPAEAGEGLLETGEGQADDVEIATFDAGDVTAGAALDGVGARFVVGFAGREVAGDFFRGKHVEVDEGGFDEGDALGVGEADERDASDYGVGAAGKFFEHVAGVVGGAGLAEDVALESDFGVSAWPSPKPNSWPRAERGRERIHRGRGFRR